MSDNDEKVLGAPEETPPKDDPATEKPEEKEEKPEENPYKAELERLQKKLAHKEKVIQDKDTKLSDVLSEVKGLRSALEEKEEPAEDEVEIEGSRFSKRDIDNLGKGLKAYGIDPKEIKGIKDALTEVSALLQESRTESALSSIAESSEEKELIRHHLRESVNPALPLDERLAAAKTLANRHLVEKKVDEETEEARGVADISGAPSSGTGTFRMGRYGATQGQKEALRILKQADGSKKWEKHIGI